MSKQHIRVGMVGAGSISDYHLSGLQAAGAEVVALFSRTEARACEKAQQFGVPSYTTDYRDILAKEDVDAVVIATPDFTHEEIARAAARAGKPVLLQKPMGRNSEECRRILAEAREAGAPLYVSFMHRYFEEVERAHQLLAEGVIGKVYQIRMRNATPGADWAAWFYQRNKVGGGAVLQLGVHGIDLLRYLFGEIEAVTATVVTMVEERKLVDGTTVRPNNEDLALANYRLASGAFAVHEVSYHEAAGTDRFRLEVYGEKGTLWLRTERGRLAIYCPQYVGEAGWFVPKLGPSNVSQRQHRHFLAMLRGEDPPDSSARDGLVSVLVSEAAYRSAESGAWEEVRCP